MGWMLEDGVREAAGVLRFVLLTSDPGSRGIHGSSERQIVQRHLRRSKRTATTDHHAHKQLQRVPLSAAPQVLRVSDRAVSHSLLFLAF
eukprot:1504591-Rhodomonas_salina.1